MCEQLGKVAHFPNYKINGDADTAFVDFAAGLMCAVNNIVQAKITRGKITDKNGLIVKQQEIKRRIRPFKKLTTAKLIFDKKGKKKCDANLIRFEENNVFGNELQVNVGEPKGLQKT